MVAHRNAHPFEMEMETTRNAFSDLYEKWRKKRISRENLKCFTLLPMSSVKGYFRWLRYDIAIFLLNFQHKKLLRNFEGPQKGSKLFLLRWNYLIWYQEMLLMTVIKHFSIGDRENGRCASLSLTRSSMSMAA